ncbi:MAG: ATP synthase F1 subunit epsilon [Clostridiales bacterium]|jgi:ATP synthase F1 epsilon subunit|nr:ATP synthase F1 subunit epsilon [Clostridiales bacterium]
MNDTFLLQITTPTQTFFDERAQFVSVTTIAGEIGILPNIAPIVTVLKAGPLRIKSSNKMMDAVSGEGFVKVRNNKVEILCNKCIWQHEREEETEEYDYDADLKKRIQSIEEHNRTKTEMLKKLSNK